MALRICTPTADRGQVCVDVEHVGDSRQRVSSLVLVPSKARQKRLGWRTEPLMPSFEAFLFTNVMASSGCPFAGREEENDDDDGADSSPKRNPAEEIRACPICRL